MMFKVRPESALAFTKASVSFVCSWPPHSNASHFEILRFRIHWWIVLLLLVQLFIPLLNGIWVFRNNLVVAVKVILLSSATAQALIKMIVCRYHRNRLQILHEELDNFLRTANPSEKLILQRYVDRSIIFYAFVGVCIYLACVGFVVEPIILSKPFPTDASYPFPVETHPLYGILYILQSFAIFHVASALFIDSQVAVLLWFTSARFEMLGDEFENVSNIEEFYICVRKHQLLLRYAHEVNYATRFIALATMATTTIGILCGGLTLLGRQPISVKLRVGNIVINAVIELFAYAWPADNLIEMSQDIGNRVYRSAWLGYPPGMVKSLVSIVQRSQKPVTVSIGGFLPALSLSHYVSFLSSAFSYFTTIRIVYASAPEVEE